MPESQPRGIGGDGVKQLLAVVPATTAGLRDCAIILTFTFTGRRRSEVFRLAAKDISFDNGRVYYSYRGKGRQGRAARATGASTASNRDLADSDRAKPQHDGSCRVALAQP